MMNNTLMEAIFISRALCHSGAPLTEPETAAMAALARKEPGRPEPPRSGISLLCGCFSVDIFTGAATYVQEQVRPGINPHLL
jgi:hypothetical protein